MPNILILTEGYKKKSLPNALCLKNIIGYLDKNDIVVDIISAENQKYKRTENEHYLYIPKKRRGLYNVCKLIFYPISNKSIVSAYVRLTEKLLNKKKYTAIIAVQNPTETVEALKIVKQRHPEQRVIMYEIDPASNRYKFPTGTLQKYLMNRAKMWELGVYKKMDCIIHMKSHESHYSEILYQEVASKFVYLDIPAFIVKKNLDMVEDNKIISLLYAGAFYKDLRNPDKMLEILMNLANDSPIEVKMYINASMLDYVKYQCKERQKFYISGYISEEKLDMQIKKCSCLVSVGNKESDFLPSKVLTYMGMKKPIIHFYYDDYDVALFYLKKYKNAICINLTDTIDDNVKKLSNFIKNSLNKNQLNEQELLDCFEENTPEFTANAILEIIAKMDDRS